MKNHLRLAAMNGASIDAMYKLFYETYELAYIIFSEISLYITIILGAHTTEKAACEGFFGRLKNKVFCGRPWDNPSEHTKKSPNPNIVKEGIHYVI